MKIDSREIRKGIAIGEFMSAIKCLSELDKSIQHQIEVLTVNFCRYSPCSIVVVPEYAYDCYRCALGQKVTIVEAEVRHTGQYDADVKDRYSLHVSARNENGESCEWREHLEDM